MSDLRTGLVEALSEWTRDPGGWPDKELAAQALDSVLGFLTDNAHEPDEYNSTLATDVALTGLHGLIERLRGDS